MGKKILKIVGVVLVLFVVILIAAPFFLQDKIEEIIKNNVNNNVNATLDFSEADLSLLSSFPNAVVKLQNISLINKEPFEGDTLFSAKEIALKMGISELFKSSGEAIGIKTFTINGATINVKIDKNENASYDIGKDTGAEEVEVESTSDGFTLGLESYAITNSKIVYEDQSTGMRFELDELQHNGKGDLSLATSELDTHTTAFVSFVMDSTNYLNRNKIKLDALIGVDLKVNKYSFLKNEAVLNQLPLVFNGFVKLNADETQEVAVSFNTPSTDFKNFLAIIPEEYSKNIENVKTTGNFSVEGNFNGIIDETHIPKFDIKILSDKASFKYPDLPKAVENVYIDVAIVNGTGLVEDTYVNIDKLSFMIDQDKFNMLANITELMGNMKVNAHLNGKMNLANIEKAYPVPADLDLKGILVADISTAFDMASVESEQYENTKTTGKMSLTDFEYASAEMPHPVKLKSTVLTFNPKTVTLNELNGTSGKTDFNATGTIDNLLGFMFNDEKIEGNFNLKSNTFALNDFMVEEAVESEETNTEETTTDKSATSVEKIKIPSFLDANITASANTVLYDNLTLKDVKGNLRIKDEKAVLTNMTSNTLGGKIGFSGEVSTKEETPTFKMKLGLDKLQIGETFKSLDLFKALAPIANALIGKIDSDIEISGNLTDDFTPNLNSISGNVLAELLATDINIDKAKMLTSLTNNLDFIKLDKLDLKGLKTVLSFEDGVVKVKPFTMQYEDIAIKIGGSHTFDSQLNYTATLDVPAKYMGSEVTSLIAKIDDDSIKNLTIPVIATIGGAYSSPKITTDMTSGVKNLTSQLVKIQKQKLINKGTGKAVELLSGILGGDSGKKDTTKTNDSSTDAVKEALGGLLGSNKEAKDTTDSLPTKKEEDMVTEKAKDILGSFFRKKKKDTVK